MMKSINVEFSKHPCQEIIDKQNHWLAQICHKPAENAVGIKKCNKVKTEEYGGPESDGEQGVSDYCMRLFVSESPEFPFDPASDPAEEILSDSKGTKEGTVCPAGKKCQQEYNHETSCGHSHKVDIL